MYCLPYWAAVSIIIILIYVWFKLERTAALTFSEGGDPSPYDNGATVAGYLLLGVIGYWSAGLILTCD